MGLFLIGLRSSMMGRGGLFLESGLERKRLWESIENPLQNPTSSFFRMPPQNNVERSCVGEFKVCAASPGPAEANEFGRSRMRSSKWGRRLPPFPELSRASSAAEEPPPPPPPLLSAASTPSSDRRRRRLASSPPPPPLPTPLLRLEVRGFSYVGVRACGSLLFGFRSAIAACAM